jgi:hypothetical protein
MLAVILLSAFGLLAALVGNLSSAYVGSTQVLNQKLIKQQKMELNQTAVLIQKITQDFLDVPGSTGNPNPAAWLCDGTHAASNQIRRVVTCRGTPAVAYDVWNRPLNGVMVRQAGMGMFAQPRFAATAPVVGITLVSWGPNGQLDTTLPVNPTTLNQLTTISMGGDDVGITFTNQRTQESNWQKVVSNAVEIGQSASRFYAERSKIFQQSLGSYYSTSNITLDDTDINKWKALPGAPNFTAILSPVGVSGAINADIIGASENLDAIGRSLVNGDNSTGRFTLNANVTSSNQSGLGTELDTLNLSLTQSNTAWVVAAPVCTASSFNCIVIKGGY